MKCPKCGHEFAVEKSAREIKLEEERLKTEQEMTQLYTRLSSLESERRNVDLEIAKRVKDEAQKEADRVSGLLTAELKRVTEQQRQEADLRLAEKTKIISDLESKLTDALQKAQLTSSQLRGEVQELDLEAKLAETFDRDEIKPVAKGVQGGDCVQIVTSAAGPVGSILWESKRTKSWSAGWVDKLLEDQQKGKHDIAIIVSVAVPDEVGERGFGLIKGKGRRAVWVCTPSSALVLAAGLRMALLNVAAMQSISEGKKERSELLYEYVTGTTFRQRIESMLDHRAAMIRTVESEKVSMNKAWATQLTNIDRLGEAVAAMTGEIEGTIGRTLIEVQT